MPIFEAFNDFADNFLLINLHLTSVYSYPSQQYLIVMQDQHRRIQLQQHRHSLTSRKVHRTRSSGATHHIYDDPTLEVCDNFIKVIHISKNLLKSFEEIKFMKLKFSRTYCMIFNIEDVFQKTC